MSESIKKPLYKRWPFWLIIFIVLAFIIVDHDDQNENDQEVADNEKNVDNEEKSEMTEEIEEDESGEKKSEETNDTLSLEARIENDIKNIVDEDFNQTEVIKVRVNEDMSVDEERYIVLIDLQWNVKNRAETTYDMLEMYSDHLAAKMAKYDDIYELTQFWVVPYHDENDVSLKRAYETKDDGMYLTDEMNMLNY